MQLIGFELKDIVSHQWLLLLLLLLILLLLPTPGSIVIGCICWLVGWFVCSLTPSHQLQWQVSSIVHAYWWFCRKALILVVVIISITKVILVLLRIMLMLNET